MNFYVSRMVRFGILFASYSKISISNQEKNKLLDIFSPNLDKIYYSKVNFECDIYKLYL